MKNPHRTLLSSLTLLVLLAGVAAAQSNTLPIGPATHWGYHHASTELEGGLRGWGAYLEGLGIGSYYWARAQQAWQGAQAQALANRQQGLQMRSDAQRRYREERFGTHASARGKADDHARSARIMAPDRLLPEDFLADGSLNWPAALCDKHFDALRNDIDRWFASAERVIAVQSETTGDRPVRRITTTPPGYRRTCAALKTEFRAHRRDLPMYEAIPILNFIDRLTYEGRFLDVEPPTQVVLGTR